MVLRKALLSVVMSTALIPIAYAGGDPEPAPASSLLTVSKKAVAPFNSVLDLLWNVAHGEGYGSTNTAVASTRAASLWSGVVYGAYRLATNTTVQQKAGQLMKWATNLVGTQPKKGVCAKAWVKECGACPKVCSQAQKACCLGN